MKSQYKLDFVDVMYQKRKIRSCWVEIYFPTKYVYFIVFLMKLWMHWMNRWYISPEYDIELLYIESTNAVKIVKGGFYTLCCGHIFYCFTFDWLNSSSKIGSHIVVWNTNNMLSLEPIYEWWQMSKVNARKRINISLDLWSQSCFIVVSMSKVLSTHIKEIRSI
jgi:hypothetical protein